MTIQSIPVEVSPTRLPRFASHHCKAGHDQLILPTQSRKGTHTRPHLNHKLIPLVTAVSCPPSSSTKGPWVLKIWYWEARSVIKSSIPYHCALEGPHQHCGQVSTICRILDCSGADLIHWTLVPLNISWSDLRGNTLPLKLLHGGADYGTDMLCPRYECVVFPKIWRHLFVRVEWGGWYRQECTRLLMYILRDLWKVKSRC